MEHICVDGIQQSHENFRRGMLGQQITTYWKDGPLNQYIDRRFRNAG